MKKLRALHLYLGCLFAPLLVFFAISGLWQTLGYHSPLLSRLSTIHTSHQLKDGSSLSGGVLMLLVVLMAVSFVFTTLLGVVLAVRQGGSRRAAYGCLVLGAVGPAVLVLLRAMALRVVAGPGGSAQPALVSDQGGHGRARCRGPHLLGTRDHLGPGMG